MAATNYGSVTDYIAAQPPRTHAALRRVRAAIRQALPKAVEGISYQIPVYKLDGKMVLYFAGFKDHYSVYPATARLLDVMPELEPFLHSKATLRFAYADPVPARLIARIARHRAAESGNRIKTARRSAKKR
jgi:uncharacterized protein YdhG (YjbR/CyaY superfamily)